MNDLEKKLRKRGMKKLDKFAHNPYHVNKPSFFSRIPLWTKIAVPAVAMTAVTFVAFVGLISHLGSHAASPAKSNQGEGTYYSTAAPAETSQDKAMNSNSSSTVLGGNGDYTTPEGYPTGITFQGAKYDFLPYQSVKSDYDYMSVSDSKLGILLGEIEIDDERPGDKIEVYEISGYFYKSFVAMKFPTKNSYYVCANSYFEYSTLGDFLDKTNLLNGAKPADPIVVYKDSTGKEEKYKEADKDTVNGYLLSDTYVANDPEDYKQYASTPGISSISIPYTFADFGGKCVYLHLFSSGHLVVRVGNANLSEEINVFNIGVDKYNSVLNYVETLSKIN